MINPTPQLKTQAQPVKYKDNGLLGTLILFLEVQDHLMQTKLCPFLHP